MEDFIKNYFEFNLYYSKDNGTTWNLIKEDIRFFWMYNTENLANGQYDIESSIDKYQLLEYSKTAKYWKLTAYTTKWNK